MTHKPELSMEEIHEIFLEAHRRGIENAIDLSIRTGVPLVVEENGIIREIKPKYKYVRVLIEPENIKSSSRKTTP